MPPRPFSGRPATLDTPFILPILGGVLSHAAIVSRGYGKPAIVGVKNVTKLIKDGQQIELDAFKGEITIK